MKLKNLFRSVLFFLLLVTFSADAFDYALEYPKGKRIEDSFQPSYDNIEIGLEQFRQSAHNHLVDSTAKALHDFFSEGVPHGTCYGQSFTFMLLNPPTAKKMQFLNKDAAQLQILWFQSQNAIHVFFRNQTDELMKKGLDIIRQGNPGQAINEDMNLIEISDEMAKLKPELVSLEAITEYNAFFKSSIQLMKFAQIRDKEEKEILAKKGFTEFPRKTLKKSDFKKNEYQKKVQEALEGLAKNPSISDVVVSFDLDVDGTPSAHAILVQLKHARVYDANSGLYRYKSKKDLINDIVVTRQKGCELVILRPYAYQNKDGKPSSKNEKPKKDHKKSKDQKKGKKGKGKN